MARFVDADAYEILDRWNVLDGEKKMQLLNVTAEKTGFQLKGTDNVLLAVSVFAAMDTFDVDNAAAIVDLMHVQQSQEAVVVSSGAIESSD